MKKYVFLMFVIFNGSLDARYKEAVHLFATLLGVCQGYLNKDTGLKEVACFCVGAYICYPLCSYSVGHLTGFVLAKMHEQEREKPQDDFDASYCFPSKY
ncbi:TPA: hypothetical protein DIC20_05765 [Candidatus Dependentiae bacterium]|nr:hypothetical protein [Candidatus Dependentiae bacterium]HCU01172.1 hypothetical protein [Candidatus Dependentiae bacterium]